MRGDLALLALEYEGFKAEYERAAIDLNSER